MVINMVIIWLLYGYYMVNDNNDNNILVGGCKTTPLKNDGVKVSWGYDIPFIDS